MNAPQETEPQPSYAPSSPAIPDFDPETFVLDDLEPYDLNIFVDAIKQQILTQIFAATETTPPDGIPEALADRTVSGHFKYHDSDRREFRDSFNNVNYSQLQDIRQLPTLTEDAQVDQRFERALVLAITTYFRIRDAGHSFTSLDLDAIHAHAEMWLPHEHATAYTNELVHIIFTSVGGDIGTRASAVTKLVAGVPCAFAESSFGKGMTNWLGRHRLQAVVDALYWMILFSMVLRRSIFDASSVYSAPGERWRVSLMAKIALWMLSGAERNIFDVASRFVDLDYAHNRIESGLALSHPILGSAIVSPHSGAVKILHDMAGCVQEKKDLRFDRYYMDDEMFRVLHDVERGISCNILGIEVGEESMVTMGYYFSKGELGRFFDAQAWDLERVLISRNGVVLYHPQHVGPWADFASSRGEGGRDPMKLVLRVSEDERSPEQTRDAIENKSTRMQTDWLLDCPVSEETKKRFRYIINRPGRAQVSRRGIRGHYGRIIAALLLICGAAVTGLNFAGRDNWLERAFDGAQVASLLAAVTVAIIFLLSGTLVDTLDLLAGKTEAQDIEHVCSLTGLTIEELQGVLTYARGTLYWLSDHRVSYCRATKLGPIVMTFPLNVRGNPETKYSLVMDDEGDDLAAVWVMQGRLSKVAESGVGDGTMRVEDMPFESRLVRAISGRDVVLE